VIGRRFLQHEGLRMKSLAATAAVCLLAQGLLTQGAPAQTQNCKALTDPLDRLTCNARINPQAAAHEIPSPKPSHYFGRTKPDVTRDSAEMSESDDVMVNQKINGICRGC
jgi:hypothetical protein